MAVYALPSDSRIRRHERPRKANELLVLDILKGLVVRSLKLDADREIVDSLPPLTTGSSSMPRPLGRRNELDQFPVPPNQKMRRYLETRDFLVIGMAARIEPIAE